MRFQVEGVFQGRRIRPRVIEGSSADAVRRSAEARGLRDVVVYPADDPFAQEPDFDEEPHRPWRWWAILTGTVRIAAVVVLLLFLVGVVRMAKRDFTDPVPAHRVQVAIDKKPPIRDEQPTPRSEEEFGSIYRMVAEIEGTAIRMGNGRFGDHDASPKDPEAAKQWGKDRGSYIDEMVCRGYLDGSRSTGLPPLELLDIKHEGDARGWYLKPEKRKVLTPDEVQRRLKANREGVPNIGWMLIEKEERDRQPRQFAIPSPIDFGPGKLTEEKAEELARSFLSRAEELLKEGKAKEAKEYARRAKIFALIGNTSRARADEIINSQP